MQTNAMKLNGMERNGRPLLQFDSLVILDLQRSHCLKARYPMSDEEKYYSCFSNYDDEYSPR